MSGEALVRIPGATAYQVAKSSHSVGAIANGDFVIAYESQAEDAGLLAQVGSVSWPLGRWAASLRFDDYTYAFQLPQLPYDDAHGYYYCVTLSPETPLELVDLLQAVLASGSAYHDRKRIVPQLPAAAAHGQPPAAVRIAEAPGAHAAAGEVGFREQPGAAFAAASRADRIASGLQRGGQLAAAGVLAAAMWAGVAIQKGAETAVSRMQPAERPRGPLSPEAQARMERAKSVAAKAAEVSGRAVSGALSVTAHVAGALAQRISATDLGRQLSEGRSMQDIRKVGVAGVEAMEVVYDSLADAARVVLAHSHAAATRVAGHKYGPGAAQATDAGMQMTQSVVETGLNVYKLRPTSLIKKAVKGTAKNVVLGSSAASAGASSASGTGGCLPPTVAGANGLAPPAAGGSAASSGHGSHNLPMAPTAMALVPQPPPPPVAAAAMLSALTDPVAPHPHGVAAAGGSGPVNPLNVVDGVVVSGPVTAYPVVSVVDYTPSAAVAASAFGGYAREGAGVGPAGANQLQQHAAALQMLPLPVQGGGAGTSASSSSGPAGIGSSSGNGGSSFGAAPTSLPVPAPMPVSPSGGIMVGTANSLSTATALPYPATSESQYTARFYPAVPRA